MTRTLVVSAWGPEIAPLVRALRGTGGRSTRRLLAIPVGVGAVEAAAGAARAIASERPDRVVFVGTAGVYPSARPAVGLGGVALASELHWVSTAVLRGDGYLPAPQPAQAKPSAHLTAILAGDRPGGLPRVAVACTAAITRSASLGRRIVQATGAVLENLEAFSVARAVGAAGQRRLELAVVLGVANRVGPEGHREWQEHHRAASWAACEVVRNLLDRHETKLGPKGRRVR